jgi:hypothetical protein
VSVEMNPSAGAEGLDREQQALLEELDRHVQSIRASALALKQAAGGIQALERNADRLLASTRMLEISVSDALGRDRGLACWTEDDGRL